MKQIYTRKDLTGTEEEPCGFVVQVCKLCDSRSLADGDLIQHNASCPFGNPLVLAIQSFTMTAPRDVICGACPAKDRPCVVPDWSLESHETLKTTCGRYAVENERIPGEL